MKLIRRIKYGHKVYKDGDNIVLCDYDNDRRVLDQTRPIKIRYRPKSGGETADVPVAGGLWTVEPVSGALWLARLTGMKVKTDEGDLELPPLADAEKIRMEWTTVIGVLTSGHDNPEGFVYHAKTADREQAKAAAEEYLEQYQPQTLFVVPGKIHLNGKAESLSMNKKRVMWAMEAVKAFSKATGVCPENDGLQMCVSDLICDLMHLASEKHLVWRELMEKADWHYAEDLKDEEEEKALVGEEFS